MKPILQVEDEENDVMFFKLAAEKAGMQRDIQVATDGQEAIDYLMGHGKFADREAYPLPCLVLLDLRLPQMPGLDVLKFIRSQPQFNSIVVIVFTSSDQDSDVKAAYQHCANSYLVKPANHHDLVELVSQIRSYWLRLNRFPG